MTSINTHAYVYRYEYKHTSIGRYTSISTHPYVYRHMSIKTHPYVYRQMSINTHPYVYRYMMGTYMNKYVVLLLPTGKKTSTPESNFLSP